MEGIKLVKLLFHVVADGCFINRSVSEDRLVKITNVQI